MRLEIEAACRLFNLSIYVIPDAADVAPTKHGTGAVVAYDEGDVCVISALGAGPEQTPAAAEREAILAAAIHFEAARGCSQVGH